MRWLFFMRSISANAMPTAGVRKTPMIAPGATGEADCEPGDVLVTGRFIGGYGQTATHPSHRSMHRGAWEYASKVR